MKSTSRTSPARIVLPLLAASLVSLAGSGAAPAFEDLADVRLIGTQPMPLPGYLEPSVDPAFGTPFMRITDPGHEMEPGFTCRPKYCRHRYSSAEAWNSNVVFV